MLGHCRGAPWRARQNQGLRNFRQGELGAESRGRGGKGRNARRDRIGDRELVQSANLLAERAPYRKVARMQARDIFAGAMRAAHVFCLPSVRESGGAVLLEAMACQRPVIAIAHGGPAELVDSAVGMAIPPDGPQQAAHAMADAFRDILQNPAAWRRRGEEGRRRAVFHARRGSKDVLEVGFAAARSHRIVAIDRCPILALSLGGAIQAAWAIAEALGPAKKPLDLHVTATDAGLDVDVRGSGALTPILMTALAGAAACQGLAETPRTSDSSSATNPKK